MKKSELDKNQEDIVSKIETLSEMRERIVRCFLDIIILTNLLSLKKPMGGYDVMDFIHKEFNILLSSGTIYSFLYSLERDSLIKGADSGRKRVYMLTEKGKNKIRTLLEAKSRILDSISDLFI